MKLNHICVFAGASNGSFRTYQRAAVDLGKQLAAREIELIYGGAKVGLMGAVADATLKAGGRVIGVIPKQLIGAEVAHDGLTEIRAVETLQERKKVMAELAQGFISLPGGLGTLEEALEAATMTQLGLDAKPCGILNVGSFFDPLLIQLDRAVNDGFLAREHREIVIADADPEGLLERLEAWKAPAPKYVVEDSEPKPHSPAKLVARLSS